MRIALRGRRGNSVSYVTRVEAARESGVGGAFDDGPAVRKEGHFVWLFPELQDEVSMANAAVGLKSFAKVAEINWAMMLVDLYRIASAKRNVRATGPSQVSKVPSPAGAAVRAGIAGGDL